MARHSEQSEGTHERRLKAKTEYTCLLEHPLVFPCMVSVTRLYLCMLIGKGWRERKILEYSSMRLRAIGHSLFCTWFPYFIPQDGRRRADAKVLCSIELGNLLREQLSSVMKPLCCQLTWEIGRRCRYPWEHKWPEEMGLSCCDSNRLKVGGHEQLPQEPGRTVGPGSAGQENTKPDVGARVYINCGWTRVCRQGSMTALPSRRFAVLPSLSFTEVYEELTSYLEISLRLD